MCVHDTIPVCYLYTRVVREKCEGGMVVCENHPTTVLHSDQDSFGEEREGGTAVGEIQGRNHQPKSTKEKNDISVFFRRTIVKPHENSPCVDFLVYSSPLYVMLCRLVVAEAKERTCIVLTCKGE